MIMPYWLDWSWYLDNNAFSSRTIDVHLAFEMASVECDNWGGYLGYHERYQIDHFCEEHVTEDNMSKVTDS